MAKQSGLHQLKGKVDGYSYYRQSGVNAGLMRRINEGMSARVKSSEEFANTRLNNSEFGNAADVAKVLASVITPKFRPMFLNFSQAKLTKSLLALIKQATGNWGQRALAAGDIDAVCAAANALAKNDIAPLCDDIFSIAGVSTGEAKIGCSFSEENAANLSAIGADGVSVKASACTIYAGTYSADDKRYIKSLAQVIDTNTRTMAASDMPDDFDDTYTVPSPSVSGAVAFNVAVVVLMPYRTINGTNYILQEKCTFKFLPLVVAQ